MSAVPRPEPWIQPLAEPDLDAVVAIENELYEFPWTTGNFRDSLAAGYSCWSCGYTDGLLGYAVMMLGAGEAHLLNLSVAAPMQRSGYGARLLEHLIGVARGYGRASPVPGGQTFESGRAAALSAVRVPATRRPQGLLPRANRPRGRAAAQPRAVNARRDLLLAEIGIRPRWRLRDRIAATEPAAPDDQPAAQGGADVHPASAEPQHIAATAALALDDRAARIARMDWPALKTAVATCEACGLCKTRTNTVFGVGDERAEWMIVGEAPGAEEDARGEPFVGQAGRLLDNMLAAVGPAPDRERLHRQRPQVPPARQPQPGALRGRAVQPASRAADRARSGRSSSSRWDGSRRRRCSAPTRASPACAASCSATRA